MHQDMKIFTNKQMGNNDVQREMKFVLQPSNDSDAHYRQWCSMQGKTCQIAGCRSIFLEIPESRSHQKLLIDLSLLQCFLIVRFVVPVYLQFLNVVVGIHYL